VILDSLRRFFARHSIERCRVVVSVSGGNDSTALLVAMHEVGGFELVAAHVNHHLRGEESDGDEAFVHGLCTRLGVPLRIADGALDGESVRHHGIEAAAREVRHARLQAIRGEVGARFIATAHQQNDQAETILMRLIGGSGIAGLRGIHPVRDDGVIRPLLEVPRRELTAFLAERDIVPRVDRSNADPRFLRNRIRVVLAALDPGEIANLAAVGEQAGEQWRVLQRLLERVEQEGDVVATASETKFLLQSLLLRHIRRLDPQSREVSSADLERLVAGLPHQKRTSVTKSLELLRRGDTVILRRRPARTEPFEAELAPGRPAHVARCSIHVAAHVPAVGIVPERIDDGARSPESELANRRQLIQLPSGAEPAFMVRSRRPGDRFQPLGLPYEKKLKAVLIDRKIAAEVRDRIPLVVWRGEIVWVAGVEVSERFKVSAGAGDRYEVWCEDEDQEVDHR
jgi:tRNA(Ile)-lysidine synthase